MPFCTACGFQLNTSAKFCGNCGHPLQLEDADPQSQTSNSITPSKSNDHPKSDDSISWNNFVSIFGVYMLLFFILGKDTVVLKENIDGPDGGFALGLIVCFDLIFLGLVYLFGFKKPKSAPLLVIAVLHLLLVVYGTFYSYSSGDLSRYNWADWTLEAVSYLYAIMIFAVWSEARVRRPLSD